MEEHGLRVEEYGLRVEEHGLRVQKAQPHPHPSHRSKPLLLSFSALLPKAKMMKPPLTQRARED